MIKRLAIALGVLSLASSSFATTLFVTSNGLVAPNANYGCPAGSPDCLASMDFQLASPAVATGTISTNSAGTLATISLDVASATFSPVPGPGSNDVFTSVHYSGTVSVFSTSSVISQTLPGTGTVTGFLNGTPFTTSSSVLNLTCALAGSSGQCGVAFGPSGFTAGSQNWLHTFNVLVAPEPAVFGLALLGFAALALRRRR